MDYFKRAGGQIALLVLAGVGVLISIYLTIVHYDSANVPLVCSANGLVNCERVLSSPFSVVPGTSIPISIPGLFWFLVSGVLVFASWRLWPQQRSLRIGQLAWSLLGMLTVFYLVYAELVRLHNICAWCTALHAIILVMFLIIVVLFQTTMDEELDEDIDEEEEATAPISRN